MSRLEARSSCSGSSPVSKPLVMRDPGWTFNQRNGIAYPPGMNPDDDAATTPPTPSLPHRDTAKVLAFAKAMYPEEFDDEGTPVGVMPSAERSDSTSPPTPSPCVEEDDTTIPASG